MAIDNRSVKQIGFVVKDLDLVLQKWKSFLNKDVDEYFITPSGFKSYYDKEADFCARMAVFHLENIDLEFITPLHGDSIWNDFITQTGGGIHHIQFHCDRFSSDSRFLDENYGILSQLGPSVRGDNYHFAYFDTGETMGCSIEIVNMGIGLVQQSTRCSDSP